MNWIRNEIPGNPRISTEHVKRILSLGGPFAQALMPRVSENGKAFLIASCDIDFESTFDIAQGISSDSTKSTELLVDFLEHYLTQDSHRYVFFENLCAKRGDPVLDRLESRIVFFDKDVIHVIEPGPPYSQLIKNSISEATGAHGFLGVCCSLTEGVSFRDSNMSKLQLNDISNNLEYIVVSALDGEAYLVWHPV